MQTRALRTRSGRERAPGGLISPDRLQDAPTGIRPGNEARRRGSTTRGDRDDAADPGGTAMSLVLEETHGAVLVLTLNRPERLNAVVPELFDKLSDVLTRSAGRAG